MAVDRLADRYAPGEIAKSRFHGVTVDARLPAPTGGEVKCVLIKPMTYMNLSGRCVTEAVRFFKVDPTEDLLVIVDDVALSCGKLRLRRRGSAGGHNGLSDIEQMLSTDEYARCRLGIDPPGRIPQVNYVTGRFTEEQLVALDPALDRACDAAVTWADEGITAAMNRFNADPSPKRPKQTQETTEKNSSTTDPAPKPEQN